jgi:hypothetical protein
MAQLLIQTLLKYPCQKISDSIVNLVWEEEQMEPMQLKPRMNFKLLVSFVGLME